METDTETSFELHLTFIKVIDSFKGMKFLPIHLSRKERSAKSLKQASTPKKNMKENVMRNVGNKREKSGGGKKKKEYEKVNSINENGTCCNR